MTNFETRLIAGLERHQYDINAQAHIAEQQNKLIKRLTNENKWQLEQLNIAQEQSKQLQALVEKLNNENNRQQKLIVQLERLSKH